MIKNLLRLTILLPLSLSVVPSKARGTPSLLSTPSGNETVAARDSEQARSAFDFVNSIGVNTHLNYFDRTYGNFPFVEQELRSIGIRHLRDGIHLQNADYNNLLYGRWIELGKFGIRFDAVLDPRSNLGPLTPALLEHVDNLSGHTIEAFEGPNEFDISGKPDWASADRTYQRELFQAAKPLPNANRIRIIGPSLAGVARGIAFEGDLAGFDEANLHSYPAGKMPSAVFPEQTDIARRVFGQKPIVMTESGYHNAINDHHDQPGVSEEAAAKYIPRLFLENFARSIRRTYLYEFLDEAPDPGLSDNQMHWGLIRADRKEKPAFLALKRMIEELNDDAEPPSLRQLKWTLGEEKSTVHHLLLQKASGEFDLVLWQEIPSYDVNEQRDIRNPPEKTVLTFQQLTRHVTLYEPSLQTAPLKSYANTATVPLEIPDHPLVIAIDLK